MALFRPTWKSEPIVDGDLTVILLTLNKPPKHWQEFHKKTLLEAIGDRPLIIVSKEPIDWNRPNTEYLYQEEPAVDANSRINNVYAQLYRALQLVKTPYVATVDDDTLYPTEHFNEYRPPLNKFSYNFCRWSLHEWARVDSFYYHTPFIDNPLLIAPTQKLLDCMKGVTVFNGQTTKFFFDYLPFYSRVPVLCFHHTSGLLGEQIKHWRLPWPVHALSIPKWGLSSEIIQEWR
jgi:hypothetical protein